MGRRMVRLIAVVILGALVLFVAASLYAALEAQLLVGASPSSDNVPYQKTQWYGFTAAAGQGYRINLTPSTGNPDLYLFDTGFNRVGYSKSAGLTQDKVWFGQATSGPMHIAAYGVYNPSSNFTIQVITSPYVKTISPTSGTVGTLVTLTGFGFGTSQGTSYVKFGAVTATSYYSWTNTQIKVYVPSGIVTRVIQAVVYVASRASNALNFTASNNSSDGTMWRYDLGRTGNYPNGPTSLPLNLKWTYTTSGPISCTPTIANNIVYFGTDKIYAVDANTGVTKWSYVVEGVFGNMVVFPESAPAIANGILYINAITGLHAIDANTGSLKWKSDFRPVSSSPAVLNGIVYFSEADKVYALDANNGVLKWSYTAGGYISRSQAISNGVIYFGDQIAGGSGKIYALNATTGALKWIYNIPPSSTNRFVSDTPVVANGILYCPFWGLNADGGLWAFDANAGILKWEKQSCNPYGPPAVNNGVVFSHAYGCGTSGLAALDANTGAVKWSSLLSSEHPIVSSNLVFITDYEEDDYGTYGKPLNLFALDANTGGIKWSYPLGVDVVITDSVVYNGKVYIVVNGNLYCFGP